MLYITTMHANLVQTLEAIAVITIGIPIHNICAMLISGI